MRSPLSRPASCSSTIRPRIRRWHRVRLAMPSSRKRCGSTIASSQFAHVPPAAPWRATATVVLCNTGSVNHVGPGRLYVTVARYWASLGFTVVRVDLGHAGDSVHVDPATENQPYAAARARRAARSRHLGTTRARQRPRRRRRLVLGRVPGIAPGHDRRRHRSRLGRQPGRLLSRRRQEPVDLGGAHVPFGARAHPRGVADFGGGSSRSRSRGAAARATQRAQAVRGQCPVGVPRSGSRLRPQRQLGAWACPVKASSVLAHDLAAIVARGGKVLLVFSTGESSARYFRKFGGPECEKLSHGNGLDVVNVEGGDHVFSPPASREELIETLTSYLVREYPAATDATRIESAPRRRPGRTYTPARVVPGERERPRLPA